MERVPEKRLGYGPGDAEDVKAHEFFAGVNWDDVYHKRIRPPYVPVLSSAKDVSNFDREFTSEKPCLTPPCGICTDRPAAQLFFFFHTCQEKTLRLWRAGRMAFLV
jgi:hypothetical protein